MYNIYTILKNILILITITNIVITIQNKLGIINPNNNYYLNILYFVGGIMLSLQLSWKVIQDKTQVVVKLEEEKVEK